MTDVPVLRTARLILRPPRHDDLATAYAIYGDPATQIFNPAGPWPSLDAARGYVHDWLEHWTRHGFGSWALSLETAPEQVIGFGGLRYARFGEVERINLGYRFSPSAWGQGLATEVSRFALRYGFETLGCAEIWAKVRETHHASRRVLEKSGMRQIDRWPEASGGADSLIFMRRADADEAA
jgi:[ribosomal protein S5]-alanine N-acetyltransferase